MQCQTEWRLVIISYGHSILPLSQLSKGEKAGRNINNVHLKTELFAIGLTVAESSTFI
jgi:hypothetical protein